VNDQQIRARGCLFGQLIGDALGSLVEFETPERIAERYPGGVRDLKDGGTWNTIAGQPTDDSEMAVTLARTIVERGTYDQSAARDAYVDWLNSGPFDIGNTTRDGLRGTPNFESQANGALMRISPLGIFSTGIDQNMASRFAREDAWITHPNQVTQDANVILVQAIAHSIQRAASPVGLLEFSLALSDELELAGSVRAVLRDAANEPPASYLRSQGLVLIALQNAYYQLMHARSFEEALVDTIARGGDTDTNAAICGALLGPIYGLTGIPSRWVDVIENCRPQEGNPGVRRPRPERYWPIDAGELADRLLRAGADHE
jgi:ADP-ribosyl-[dinitrogen reductase] hydrolase